jgi:S1-C subfamily serine protease
MQQFTLDATACPSCLTPVRRGTRFCGECGADVVSGELRTVSAAEPRDPDPVRRVPLDRAAVVLALCAAGVAILLAGVVYLDRSQTDTAPAWPAEAKALHAEIAGLQAELDALSARSSKLAGRLDSTAQKVEQGGTGGVESLAARVLKSVFTVTTRKALGAGFVAWTDGGATYLVTANHVVADSPSRFVTIERRSGSWSGEIVRNDPAHDLAVIRVSGAIKGAAPLWQEPGRGGKPKPGEQLVLAGSPYGLDGTVTTGVVSRVTKKLIQTDAAANPGNSGGPAVDRQGRVVGVLVSGGGQNLNFAVPIDLACAVIRDC